MTEDPRKPSHYILDAAGNPVPCADLLEWAKWFETANRHVADHRLNGCRVSTVFLGNDHNFSCEGPPVLWETMVFWRQDGRPRNAPHFARRRPPVAHDLSGPVRDATSTCRWARSVAAAGRRIPETRGCMKLTWIRERQFWWFSLGLSKHTAVVRWDKRELVGYKAEPGLPQTTARHAALAILTIERLPKP